MFNLMTLGFCVRLEAVRQQRNSSMPMFVGEIFHLYQAAQQFDWPFWLKPENLRDAQGRPPTAPDYNQGTLWIPSEEVQKKEGQSGVSCLPDLFV